MKLKFFPQKSFSKKNAKKFVEPKILPKNSRAAKFPKKIPGAKNFHEKSSKLKILTKNFLKPFLRKKFLKPKIKKKKKNPGTKNLTEKSSKKILE